MRIIFSSFLLLSTWLISCTSTNSQAQNGVPTSVDAPTFSKLIQSKNDAQIVDVRTPEEYNGGYITGAMNLDYNGQDFERQVASLDKSKTVLIYCLSGGRSGSAAKELRKKGFKEVIELQGGTMAWSRAGLPLEGAKAKQPGIDLATFQQSIQTNEIHLVDFFAPWCAPCKQMKPVMDEIEKEFQGKVIVHRINIDENQALAKAFNVEVLPTIKIFKEGKETWNHQGVIEKKDIVSNLK
jgi:thioredoxin 1